MTWHTPSGERCLDGEEAELVRDSLATMVEELASCRETEEEPWEYGITLFDDLTWQQQLAMLDLLATNLLHVTEQTLELSGINEAGVAAIFQNIFQQIELEVELQDVSPPEYRYRWREAVVGAYQNDFDLSSEENELRTLSDADSAGGYSTHGEIKDGETKDELSIESTDLDQWKWLVDDLADRILWDRDFEMVNEMIDAPPEKAAVLRAALGIDSEYYTAIAPDPTDGELDQLFSSLRELTRAKPR